MKRKVVFFFSTLVLLSAALYFFRNQVLAFTIHQAMTKSFTSDQIVVKNGNVSIQGLHYKKDQMEVTLDEVKFRLKFSTIISHPSSAFSLCRKGAENLNEFLIPSKEYGLNLKMRRGVLTLDNQRYYFDYTRGKKKREIGLLRISHDPGLRDHPFCTVRFHLRGNQLGTELHIDEVPSERLLQLAAFASPKHFDGFSKASGNIQLHANILFEEEGQLEELSTRFRCENFELVHPEKDLLICVDSLSGDLNYPDGVEEEKLPVWKRVQCGLNLLGGSIRYGDQFSLSKLSGHLLLDSHDTPTLRINGELAGYDKPLALELNGKGALHADHAYWLEFGLGLNDLAGTECDAFVSICRPEEESFVAQLEANNLLPGQVEMLKEYFSRYMPRLESWTISQGVFGGKLVALFEKGNLSHFEIQDLEGKDVLLRSLDKEPLYLASIKGDGRLFSDLNFQIELPTSHFFGFISSEMKEAYANYRPDDLVKMSATMQFGNSGVETKGSVDFLAFEESLQFGFKSQNPFPTSLAEMSEGWARSEKLSHHLYGPFVHLASEDLQIYGDVDLLASYDGKLIDSAIQVDHFLAKHPLLDVKAKSIGEKEKTVGRIKFHYDPLTHHFEGSLPLREAFAYDRQYGLYFENVDGDLQFAPKKFTGNLAKADVSYDSINLVKNLGLYFSYDKTLDFHEVRADLAVSSNHNYNIYLPKLSSTSIELHAFDGKKELVRIQGDRAGSWAGNLFLPSHDQSYPVSFAWDPLTNDADFAIETEEFALKLKKEEGKYAIEKCKIKNLEAVAAFTIEDGNLQFTNFEMHLPRATLIGSGNAKLQLPQEGQSLGLFGSTICSLETKTPISLRLEGKEEIKWAYNPEMGFVCSGLDFSSDACSVQVEELDRLPSGKTAAHKIHFDLSQDVMQQIFNQGSLPSFLQDFRSCKSMTGNANLEIENEKAKASGTLKSPLGDLELSLDWDGKKGEFSLGQEDKLTFKAASHENEIELESIQGTLGRLNANLKKTKKGQFKGNLKLDFSLFHELFDLPLNRFVNLWKAGAGYELTGLFSPAKRLYDWGFKGKVKGNGFECGGYQLRSMEAKVEVEPGQITIENLDVSDEAGKLWIGEGALMKVGQPGDWMFSFPLVELRGFQPSFLRKMAGPESPITPLVVKSATISDCRGMLDNPSSITGHGALRFTNILRKGQSKLPKNLPLQVLEQLGLSGELFVPVSGEMSYVLQNGRIYLRELSNVVSAQGRSEFTPPKNGVMGHLDYQGNLFIDLLVKQKAGRTPPVSLKVRGKWEDPQITIR